MGRYWLHTIPDTVDDEGQRECARGERCLAGTSIRLADGSRRVQGAFGYQAFCRIDRSFILQCLEQFPGYWRDLRAMLGEKGRGHGEKVSGSRTAPLPVNLTVDSLMDELVLVTASWAGRVAVLADLHSIDVDRPLRAYAEEPFIDMCEVLGAHLDAFLGLAAEPMHRFLPLADADDLPDGTFISRNFYGGYAQATLELSGASGGLEVIRLNGRCRWLLGLTGKDEQIAGRCFACEKVDVLVRPDGSAGLVDYAECSACGTHYTGTEYTNLMRSVYEQVLADQQKQAS